MEHAPSPAPGWWLASDGRWYPPQPAPARRRGVANWGCIAFVAAILLGAGLVAALAAEWERGQPGDGPGRAACESFRAMVRDADVLTNDQAVERAQGVYRDGRYSTMPGVAAASRDLTAAVIAGDTTAVADAVQRMDRACATP